MSGRATTKSQLKALLWEEGRVGGSIAAACTLFALPMMLVNYRVPTAWVRDEYTTHFAALGMPVLAALLLILNPDSSGHMVGGFPKRILRLPVQTPLAVAVSLFSRTAIVFAMSAFLLAVAAILFDGTPGISAVCAITSLYIAAQLIDWIRGPIRGLTTLIAFLGICFVVLVFGPKWIRDYVAFLPIEQTVNWIGAVARSLLTLPPLVLLFLAVPLAYACAAPLVHLDRVGRWYGIPEIWEWPRRIRLSRSAGGRSFYSPMGAQVWFELRRASISFAPGIAFIAVMLVFLVTFSNYDPHSSSRTAAGFSGTFFGLSGVVVIAGIHGVTTRVLGFRNPAGKSGYEYLQPLTTSQFATARIIVALLLVVPMLIAALAVHVVGVGQYFLGELASNALQEGFASRRELVWVFLGRGLLVGIFAWSAIAIGTWFFRYVMFPVLAMSLFAYWLIDFYGKSVRYNPDTPPAVVVLELMFVSLMVVFAVTAFAMALTQRLLIPRVAAGWAAAWLLVAWLFRYAIVSGWAPEPITAKEHFQAALTALGASAPVPLAYLAILFDVRRRRHSAAIRQDPNQHHRTIPASPMRALRLAGAALVALAVVWLGWPSTPAYVQYQHQHNQPASLAELNASYVEPLVGENMALEYMRVIEQGQGLRQRVADAETPRRAPKANEMIDDWRTKLYLIGRAELPRAVALDKANWDATEAYWSKVTSHVAPELMALALRSTATSQYRYPGEFSPDRYRRYHIDWMYTLSTELQLDALHWAVAQKPSDAADSVIAQLAVARSLSQEPDLWAQRSRLRLYSRAARSLEMVLNRSTPGDADLKRMQQAFSNALSDATNTDAVERGLVGEGIVTMSILDKEYANNHYQRKYAGPTNLALWLIFPPSTGRMYVLDEVHDSVEMVKLAWPDTRSRFEENNLDYIWTRFLVPDQAYRGDFYSIVEDDRRARVYLQLARVALAVERYRVANNAVPKTLDKLVPTYLDKVPDDDFADPGIPLRYVASPDDEYRIYSVDYDGDDDEGRDERSSDEYRRKGDQIFTVAPMSFRTGPQIQN